jgi:endonuclease YncB( thermonuclease family)
MALQCRLPPWGKGLGWDCCWGHWWAGQQARTYLQQRLPIAREVTLEVKTTDRYGRSVAEVISEINLSLAMVEDGQAFACRNDLGGCDAKEYLDAEFRASRRRIGVWLVPGGVTRPWNFRLPGPSSCCARGTPISMAMGRPVSRCAECRWP